MFYERFEKLCKEREVTPAQVRKQLDISQSTMASWKSRDLTPNAVTLVQLADYFEITVDALLGRTSSSNRLKFRDEILYLFRLLEMPKEELANFIALITKTYETFDSMKWSDDEKGMDTVSAVAYGYYSNMKELMDINNKKWVDDIYNLYRRYEEIRPDVKKILDSFQRLNVKGKREAVKRVNELTYVPEYQHGTTP